MLHTRSHSAAKYHLLKKGLHFYTGLEGHEAKSTHFYMGLEGHETKSPHFYTGLEGHAS